jgi:hypothetical protein
MTPKFEVLIWKRITKELKPSKRKTHSWDTVASLLAVQDKLTTKDALFSQKLSNYLEATKDDDKEEENSEDILHYLRVVVDNKNNLVVVVISLVYIALFVWSRLWEVVEFTEFEILGSVKRHFGTLSSRRRPMGDMGLP